MIRGSESLVLRVNSGGSQLPSIRYFAFVLVLLIAVESRTQVVATTPLDRQIEVFIRTQFAVPPDCDLTLGGQTASNVLAYNKVPVTLVCKGKQSTFNFLISKDGKTLARLEEFDITKNPALAVDVTGRPIRGDADAKVEIINFDDLECPWCALLNSELSRDTLAHYKGLIKIVYKDFPLEDIHPWAMHAAVDANCLADLDHVAYWAYVDYVHSHAQDITGAEPDPNRSFLTLDQIASTIGATKKVDTPRLVACLKTQDESVVKSSINDGISLQFDAATPQIFVDGERLPNGARPVEELWPAIDRALKAQGIQPPPRAPQAAASDPGKEPQPNH
jgi:protein-disulfide isomerase